jgi:hypothetical protein
MNGIELVHQESRIRRTLLRRQKIRTAGREAYKKAAFFSLDVPNARIYQVEFKHFGAFVAWNYNPDGGHAGWTQILPDGKSFVWRRKWDGGSTLEVYTAYYEV